MKKYLRTDLERIVLTQPENLNAQGKHIDLLKEQNILLVKFNHKLIDELSDKSKKEKPYLIPKRKKHELQRDYYQSNCRRNAV